MIRIAYVVHSFNAGGLERCVAHLVNRIDSSRFEPIIISLTTNGAAFEWINDQDVRCVELKKPSGNSGECVKRLRQALVDHQIDIAHSHNWGTLLETVLACRRIDIKHLHAAHGLELDDARVTGLKRLIRRKAMRWATRRADWVVACADSVRHWIQTDLKMPSKRLSVLTNGVTPPQQLHDGLSRDDLRTELGLPLDGFLLTSVGRLVQLKGFEVAIEALSIMRTDLPDAHLVLVGSGEMEDRLIEFARGHGVRDQVHLVGRQSNVGDWLRASDLYLNSSHTEAMNMGILEAFSLGVPVVATDVGDNAMMVKRDPPAGLVVPPGRPDEMAQACRSLALDEDLRKKYAETARKRYASEYRTEQMCDRYYELYSKLHSG